VTRVYRELDDLCGRAVDTQHTIGTIDISSGIGSELVSSWFSPDIASGDLFYTGLSLSVSLCVSRCLYLVAARLL
jgi:hypothetical protein